MNGFRNFRFAIAALLIAHYSKDGGAQPLAINPSAAPSDINNPSSINPARASDVLNRCAVNPAAAASQIPQPGGLPLTNSGLRSGRSPRRSQLRSQLHLAAVVRKTTLERFPQIEAQLEKLSAQLDNKTMGALNGAVDLQGQKVDDVALEFLHSRGL